MNKTKPLSWAEKKRRVKQRRKKRKQRIKQTRRRLNGGKN